MRSAFAVAAALLVAGCGAAPIDPARAFRVDQLLRKEFAPAPAPRILATWYTEGGGEMVCGEAEAPRSLRASQSTIRFVSFGNDLSLEPHLVTFDATGAEIAREGVAIFDHLWTQSCAPAAPLGRRLAGWFHWKRGEASPDTPLTNAYADQALRGAGERP